MSAINCVCLGIGLVNGGLCILLNLLQALIKIIQTIV